MLTYVERFLKMDDEVDILEFLFEPNQKLSLAHVTRCSYPFSLMQDFFGPEEAAILASESPDVEFEGMGDYEESIYANWRQPKGKGDVGESDMT